MNCDLTAVEKVTDESSFLQLNRQTANRINVLNTNAWTNECNDVSVIIWMHGVTTRRCPAYLRNTVHSAAISNNCPHFSTNNSHTFSIPRTSTKLAPNKPSPFLVPHLIVTLFLCIYDNAPWLQLLSDSWNLTFSTWFLMPKYLLRLKFHLAGLDSTRLDTFDFVEPVETSVSSETSRALPTWRTTNDLVQV